MCTQDIYIYLVLTYICRNTISVLVLTITHNGKLVMSDVISEMFGRMEKETFQSLFPLPVDETENCLPNGLPSTSEVRHTILQ